MDSAVRRAFSTRRRGLSATSGVDDVDAVPNLPWKKRVFGIGPEHPVCFVPGTAPASKLSALRAYFFCRHPRYPAPCLIFRTFDALILCARLSCVLLQSRPNLPASNLIHPLSPWGVGWVCSTAALLLYTAVVTPAVITFHWLDPACTAVPTLYPDVFVDCFFLLDIAISFGTGVMEANTYVDDCRQVASIYLRGWFLFDLVTSFPVSFFELAVMANCSKAGSDGDVDSGPLRFIRVMKPLRWFKLARIMKLGKMSEVSNSLMDYFNISPRAGRGMKVMSRLSHVRQSRCTLLY